MSNNKRIEDLKNSSSKGKLKFLANDSIVYGSISAISKFLAIFLTPIITRLISKGEFGQLDGIANFMPLFIAIIIMGMDSAVARFFYDTEDKEERYKVVSTGFIIQLFIGLIVVIGLITFSAEISGYYLSNEIYFKYILIAAGIILSTTVFRFFQNLLKWTFQRNRFMIVSLGLILLQFAVTLILLLVFDMGIKSVFIGQFVAFTAFGLLGMYYCREYLKLVKDWKYIWPFLKFGFPYMLVALMPALLPAFDRQFITNANYLGAEKLGEYGLAYRVISFLQLPITGFQSAWAPFVYATYKDANSAETFSKVAKYYSIILATIALGITITAYVLIILLGSDKYLASQELILPLAFATIIQALSWITGIGIDLSKKTYFTTIAYTISLLTSIGLIYFLAPQFGLVGIAYAMLIGKIILTLLITIFSKISYPVDFKYGKMLIILAIAFVGSYLNKSIAYNNIIEVIIAVSSLTIYLGFIWRLMLDSTERKLAISHIQKLKAKIGL